MNQIQTSGEDGVILPTKQSIQSQFSKGDGSERRIFTVQKSFHRVLLL